MWWNRPKIAGIAVAALFGWTIASSSPPCPAAEKLMVGGYVQNVNPHTLPVSVNGGFVQQMADRVIDPLAARTLVIGQGEAVCSLTVVDSCLMPRDLLDAAKRDASAATNIPVDRMLISATHAHSVPAVMGIHGSEPSPEYREQLQRQITSSIIEAHKRLRPARVGWAKTTLNQFVYCRRWLMQPGTAMTVPFTGRDSNQVQMNPGHKNPNKIRPVGPVDTDVIVLAFQTPEGKPLAILGNFNTHYAGAPALSSDYFGHFCRNIGDRLDADGESFVALMSNGTSGDANCIDFARDDPVPFDAAEVAGAVMDKAVAAYESIENWQDSVPIDMVQQTLTLDARIPTAEEVTRAREATASWIDQRLPENVQEVYARETILLSEMPPTREVVLQALRIGAFAVTAAPCEVYGATGLGIKSNSPFPVTMNIGWANDYLGYLPPPEHFELGGYTTWRARSSCLETQAEPKIRGRLLEMLRALHDADAQQDVPKAQQDASQIPARRTALAPPEALASLQTHPELSVQLVAHEPNVIDPVSIAFDHQGRMWVVEMRDYPSSPPGASSGQGRIQVLQDENGDGFYETATTFAENLSFPTGLTHFRDGVIVTMAGKIAYMADTNGDLVCDHIQDWFTGFTEGNTQLRANHPTWLLENQVHVASGLTGGEIQPAAEEWSAQASPLSLSLRDFEFSPFTGTYHSVAGNSQFGFYQDEAGQSFVCSNRNPCRLLMAEASQVAGNPLIPLSQWSVDVLSAAEDSQIFPLVDAWTTSNLHTGQFTAACGVYRYQSDLLRPWIGDDFFACEPTGSLVQRHRTVGHSIVPQTERGRPGVEFLASRDPWFRPVDLTDGPDGALYVVDMHRAVIEHPEWVPEELKHREDQRWGDAAGRIYRLVPAQGYQPTRGENLAQAAIPAQVAALADPNRWRRGTAARLLAQSAVDPADPRQLEVVTALREGLGQTQATTRILWMLRTLDAVGEAELRIGIEHSDPTVRRQSVRLLSLHRSDAPMAELRSSQSAFPQLGFMQLADDEDPRVRYQVILELAPSATARDVDTLLTAARPRRTDSPVDRAWIANAASLIDDSAVASFLRQGLQQGTLHSEIAQPLVRRTGWTGQSQVLAVLLEAQGSETAETLLSPYVAGMQSAGRQIDRDGGALTAAHLAWLDGRLADARRNVLDPSGPTSTRLAAFAWLTIDGSRESLQVRRELIASENPEMFSAAVHSFRDSDDPAIGGELARRLPHLEPSDVKPALALLIDNPHWTPSLLGAIESQQIPRGWMDAASQGRLRRHPAIETRTWAERVLSDASGEDRLATVARYQKALGGTSDLEAGRQAFQKHCGACHRVDGFGSVVGPDISDQRTQTREQILIAILDPNAAIDANYIRYSVLTTSGQIIEGLLKDRTEHSATLALQNGINRTIAAENIETIKASGVSLMPEGLESGIDPDSMRDLIEYLKQWRFMEGSIPGRTATAGKSSTFGAEHNNP